VELRTPLQRSARGIVRCGDVIENTTARNRSAAEVPDLPLPSIEPKVIHCETKDDLGSGRIRTTMRAEDDSEMMDTLHGLKRWLVPGPEGSEGSSLRSLAAAKLRQQNRNPS
jgi:hypothetical protein